jgi:hypothetical protein
VSFLEKKRENFSIYKEEQEIPSKLPRLFGVQAAQTLRDNLTLHYVFEDGAIYSQIFTTYDGKKMEENEEETVDLIKDSVIREAEESVMEGELALDDILQSHDVLNASFLVDSKGFYGC